MIAVNADFTQFMEATGVISGICGAVESDIYVDYILEDAMGEMKDEFNMEFRLNALNHPEVFHHVYEWNQIGINPLYFLIKSGRGREKAIGFAFRQSLKAVPKPDADKTGIPQENIDRLKNRSIFRLKAMVMETGAEVNIRPNRAKILFIPTPGAENKNGDVVNFLFRKRATLTDVGGEQTTGSFTAFWNSWWLTRAPGLMEATVLPRIERGIDKVTETNLRKIRRGKNIKSKKFSINPTAGSEQMARIREAAAQKDLTRYAQSFVIDEDWDEE